MKVFKIVYLFILGIICLFIISGCGPTRPPEQSAGHITDESVDLAGAIPAPVAQTTLLPEPKLRPNLETYTLVVNDVPVKDLLFSMARDAAINLDIHGDIEGTVTLNAIDQTLPQILERISHQANIRYEIESNSLRIRADLPYLRHYIIDYVNMSRESSGVVRVATTLGSTGQGSIGGDGSSSSEEEDNSSLTEVNNKSDNNFWETLASNINAILDNEVTESESSGTTAATNNNVIVNKETGIILVRATYKQHKIIQQFVDIVLASSKRQVMIEVTIAEIKLSDRYQSGVDWSLVASDPTSGVGALTDLRGSNLAQPAFSSMTFADEVGGDQLTFTLRSLEQFGDVKVLSSPKVMAINNQPAILKVVDNVVYFEMKVNTSTNLNSSLTTFNTTIQTVPVGFVMSVTPFINEVGTVTLNIRPTISRIIDYVEDPNPQFKVVDVISEVPVIQVREIESILQVNSGDTAIIGGLMQDTVNDVSSGIPYLSAIPWIGWLFRYEDDLREKSELVIFIKPVVIKQASLANDLAEYRKFLPKKQSRINQAKKDTNE